ncbi:alcohol dehydrogenase catalytic domain-containing protein [Ruania zhangjianzhongii]|uniref:alcohol dehydrogenase catalytic domain-containing protein n=1 Tax=Ruania zhangjianzhongii TaxID=2603206 RepID=UPI0011CA173F|nr:alcohol dehydrogenase catalytic domain-containing protein [Ruania zhangjianzhongii]
MRAAVLHGIGDLRIEDRTRPAVGASEVLLQVMVVGVCGSDLHFYEEGRSGSAVVAGPTVLGHEFSGRIIGVGTGVPTSRIGERVAVEPGTPCGSCQACTVDAYNHCERIRFVGAATIDGAMQEYITVPAGSAYPVPAPVSDAAAAMIEPLSVAVHAVGRAPIGPAQHVLVSGAGPIGHLVAQLAHRRGAASVWLVDPNRDRLAHAHDPIRIATPDEWAAGGRRVDVAFECSGSPNGLTAALTSLRYEASLVIVGVGPRTLELPMDAIQEGELTITGSHRYRHTWPEAIQMVARADVDLDALITHTFPLDDAAAALRVTRTENAALKAVIRL